MRSFFWHHLPSGLGQWPFLIILSGEVVSLALCGAWLLVGPLAETAVPVEDTWTLWLRMLSEIGALVILFYIVAILAPKGISALLQIQTAVQTERQKDRDLAEQHHQELMAKQGAAAQEMLALLHQHHEFAVKQIEDMRRNPK